MENNKKLNDSMLEKVAGGWYAPESKYDVGAKVFFVTNDGQKRLGIIVEAMYSPREQGWIYQIGTWDGSVIGSFEEDSILGPAQ